MKKINNELLQNYGERIRVERIKLGMTQEEFANKLHLSKQQINNYELTRRQPDYKTLLEICKFLNVSTDYILGNTESKKVENTEISCKLGLSDMSIEKLCTYAEKTSWNKDIFNGAITSYQYYSIIINKIIENENFGKLIFFIRKYINSFKIEALKREIKQNEVLYKDDITGEEITNKKIMDDAIEQGIYDTDYEESSTDICAYKINVLFNKIIEKIINQLEPSFSEHWELNEDKTEIIKICKDGSANFKFFKRR